MEKYFDLLKNVRFFDGISQDEMLLLFGCLSAKIEQYKKNEAVFLINEPTKYVGIVLSGRVQIEKDDFYGNKTILATIQPGETFAEAFSCAEIGYFPVNAIATADSVIMLMDYRKIITTCSNSCAFHQKLIFNMLEIIAQKNIMLNQKIEILAKRTTREKLLAFLSLHAKNSKSSYFTIDFNRQQLADFLCVDRSAMSNELCKMRDEGMLEFFKNEFKLHHSGI